MFTVPVSGSNSTFASPICSLSHVVFYLFVQRALALAVVGGRVTSSSITARSVAGWSEVYGISIASVRSSSIMCRYR
jgi:hypothetical protein